MFYLNKKIVSFGSYPNGEIYLPIAKLQYQSYNRIVWIWENNDDFVKIMMLKRYLDSIFTNSELTITYMPYSRADRSNDDYAFSLKYITEFINSLNFFAVTIREPHSEVTPALIEKSIVEDWCKHKIKKIIKEFDIDSLFFPDAGAQKRYAYDYPYASGYKMRDFKSGDITNYFISGTVGDNVLIVDDLCSRGGTFVHASTELKKAGAKKVYLLVSYLEDNVATGVLADHVEMVFAGNNVPNFDKVVVLD